MFGLALGWASIQRAVLVLTVAAVLVWLNTAIESVVDLAGRHSTPWRKSPNCAAAAARASISSLVIALLLLLPCPRLGLWAMLLVIDNYEATFNLVQYFGELAARIPSRRARVERNDALTVAEIHTLKPDAILLTRPRRSRSPASACRC